MPNCRLFQKLLITGGLLSLSLSSCKTRSNPNELREIWFSLLDTKWKAAQEVSDRNEYIRTFAQLPLSGSVKPLPWRGYVYPNETAGLGLRIQGKKSIISYQLETPGLIKDTSNLSPIEKYDLLLGSKNWEMTLAERNRTALQNGKSVDPRKSLNSDWAAASILFAEPTAFKATTDNGQVVMFTANDIKALLTHFVSQNSVLDNEVETRSLGGVCRLDSDSLRRGLESRTLTAEGWLELKNDECFAVNAGAFHLALTNLIGIRQETFVIDPRLDLEFTHFPLVSFKTETLGAAIATENNHQEIQVKTLVTYVLPTSGSVDKVQTSTHSETFRYTIEMDEAGEIVGGNWLSSPPPQLAWIQNRPKFTPDFAKLEKLYTMSVSLPSRMAMRNFAAIDSEDPQVPVREMDPLAANKKYRLELSGDIPRGADGLKTFLMTAFRTIGLTSVYRNTFADEDAIVSIEVQFHNPTTFRALKQAIRAHSNGRSEAVRLLR